MKEYRRALDAAVDYLRTEGSSLETFEKMCKAAWRRVKGPEPEGTTLQVRLDKETHRLVVGYIVDRPQGEFKTSGDRSS